MTIAISTIILVLFLLPGNIFVNKLYSDPRNKTTIKSPFQFVYKSILPSILLYGIFFFLCNLFVNIEPNYELIDQLMHENIKTSNGFRNLFPLDDICLNLLFFIGLIVFSYVASSILRRMVLKRRLDLKFSMFRLRNEFFYILYGSNPLNLNKNIDMFHIRIQLKSSPGKIYSGILIDYVYSNNGFKHIILADASVHNVGDKSEEGKEYLGGTTLFDFSDVNSFTFLGIIIEKSTSNDTENHHYPPSESLAEDTNVQTN